MKYIILFLFLSLTCLTFSQESSQYSVDLTDNITHPKHLIIPKVSKEIVIDGIAESAWNNVEFSSEFVDIEGLKDVKYSTRMKMLWDEKYLYVYAELEEPHIWGDITQRDAIIYLNNDFEVFIDPSGRGENYGEIEMNALNTVWDLLLDKPYRSGGFANFHWDLDSLKTAVKVYGTINDPSDVDEKWTLEMAIPMKPLIELRNDRRRPIQEGDLWRMNFSRVEWNHELTGSVYSRKKVDGVLQSEYNWVWSEQKAINMHLPEMWATVQFTEHETAEGIEFPGYHSEQITQVLYALFRRINFAERYDTDPHKIGEETEILVHYFNDSLVASLVRTAFGFELSCRDEKQQLIHTINEKGERTLRPFDWLGQDTFRFSTWAHGAQKMDSVVWIEKLKDYQSMGISDILVGGSPEFLADLVKLAQPRNMKIHAWMWTLNRPNDSIAKMHPDWYAVNRNGENSLDYRAYVDYYQWLSPFSDGAREHVKENVRKLLKVEGLASIHLDYVRYVDVILGADLQPKYDLVQTVEMPEYDYGYHPAALAGFKELFGKNPMEMEHPELSTEWRQFRLNAVTTLVNEIAELVHSEGQKLTAAVFPFPEMSRQMVRQAWDDWNLDAAYPMIYHNFYRENINWIGFATEQGVNDVDFPINAGLYMPGFETAAEFEEAILLAKAKGAKGICVFTADGMKPEFEDVLKKLSSDFSSH